MRRRSGGLQRDLYSLQLSVDAQVAGQTIWRGTDFACMARVLKLIRFVVGEMCMRLGRTSVLPACFRHLEFDKNGTKKELGSE